MLQLSFQRLAFAPSRADGAETGSREPIGQGRRVLVIEDEDLLRRNITDYLEVDGFEALACADGESGVKTFETSRPDVVLLDLRLPGMDGLAVLKLLRAANPEARVIMMTAYDGGQVADEARQAGAQALLVKPLILSEVSQAIDRIL